MRMSCASIASCAHTRPILIRCPKSWSSSWPRNDAGRKPQLHRGRTLVRSPVPAALLVCVAALAHAVLPSDTSLVPRAHLRPPAAPCAPLHERVSGLVRRSAVSAHRSILASRRQHRLQSDVHLQPSRVHLLRRWNASAHHTRHGGAHLSGAQQQGGRASHRSFGSLSLTALCCCLCCVVTEERSLFARESSSKLYSTSAYFLSKMIVEISLGTAFSVAFGAIGYAMVGMNADRSEAGRQAGSGTAG